MGFGGCVRVGLEPVERRGRVGELREVRRSEVREEGIRVRVERSVVGAVSGWDWEVYRGGLLGGRFGGSGGCLCCRLVHG